MKKEGLNRTSIKRNSHLGPIEQEQGQNQIYVIFCHFYEHLFKENNGLLGVKIHGLNMIHLGRVCSNSKSLQKFLN